MCIFFQIISNLYSKFEFKKMVQWLQHLKDLPKINALTEIMNQSKKNEVRSYYLLITISFGLFVSFEINLSI